MPTDQAFDKNLQHDPQKSIRKGFVWIGLASTLSQIVSALTMLILMMFLSKDEIGVATLAVAIGVIFEAFNALGTNQAVLQDKNLTPNEMHSMFWFASLFGIAAYLLAIPMAWFFSWSYGIATLVPMILVMMLKMPIASIAAIPLQLVNRRFEFHKISILQSVTTLACSTIKIVMAALGCGAWSLVTGEAAYALGTLFFAFYFSKYHPVLHFKWAECKRFISYGIKICASNALDQFTKNIHYLIVGKFLGGSFLGIYRIAYELAMTPALALFNVVTKSSFPIFSRLQDNRLELSRLFAWNQKNLALFAIVPTLAIFFCAQDVFNLIPNDEWRAAVPIIPFVLALSLIKTLLLTYPDLFRACGKPSLPIYFQAVEALGIALLGSAALHFIPSPYSLHGMICFWILLLLLLAIPFKKVASRFIDISLKSILKSLSHGILFFIVTFAVSYLPYRYRAELPYADVTHIFIEACIILACLWAYVRFVLRVNFIDFLKRRHKDKATAKN